MLSCLIWADFRVGTRVGHWRRLHTRVEFARNDAETGERYFCLHCHATAQPDSERMLAAMAPFASQRVRGTAMPRLSSIQLVVFDLAGTTVDDRKAGASLVVSALVRAFAQAGVPISPHAVHPHRGREKREAIRAILAAERLVGRADQIYDLFMIELNADLALLTEIDGAASVFRNLKERGIRVAVGSGFPTDVVQRIVEQLGWQEADLIDYAGSAQAVGAGRPDPAMIRDAMQSLGIVEPKCVLKVGDTMADIEEGRNAGAWTVGVLTGSQSRDDLAGAGPDFILPSIREVPGLLN